VLVRELRNIPGAIHIGHTTAIQTVYSQAIQRVLPSGLFRLTFPLQKRMSPTNHLGQPFLPHVRYRRKRLNEKGVLE
jgi:hypothetical protein